MEYILHVITLAFIYSIMTLGLNLILGYAGQPSFGQGAFFCLGAYTSALLVLKVGISPWLALPAAVVFSVALAAIVGILTFRLQGDEFALATFGLAVVSNSAAINLAGLTNGARGLSAIPHFHLLSWEMIPTWINCLMIGCSAALCLLVAGRIVRSPYGRVLRAIREDEVAVEAVGRSVLKFKWTVFVTGSAMGAMAGSLYSHYVTYISPSSFDVIESITVVLMVVFGGMASLRGSIIGAFTLVMIPEGLRYLGVSSPAAAQIRQMTYGLLLVVLMIAKPSGLLGRYRFLGGVK